MPGPTGPAPRVGRNRGLDSRFDPARRVDGSAFVTTEYPSPFRATPTINDRGGVTSWTGGGVTSVRNPDTGRSFVYSNSDVNQTNPLRESSGDVWGAMAKASPGKYSFERTGGYVSGDGPPRGSWVLPQSRLQ